MQADWEFEIGPGAPLMDGAWPGLVDLRRKPGRIREIEESARLPALAPALLQLNSSSSPVWTSKCDLFTPESLDPDELDAPPTQVACALACYIDLLPCHTADWTTPAQLETFCRRICGLLSNLPVPCCRADLVVRRVLLAPDRESLGITAYLSACGAGQDLAAAALSAAVSALADSLCAIPAQEKTT